MPCIIFCSSSAAGPLPHPPPPAPFTPPRARAGRRRSGPAAQKGGRRASFTFRPAPLPSRSGAMTPFPGCAAPPTHPKVTRRPPSPAPSTPRTAAAGAAGRALRVRACSIAATGASTGVARPHEAEKAPAEPARGREMALWEDRSGRHPGCARRFPHDSAVSAPMRWGAGRNDPPRAPESESDGGRRAPRRARGRCGSADHETARMASAPTRPGSVAELRRAREDRPRRPPGQGLHQTRPMSRQPSRAPARTGFVSAPDSTADRPRQPLCRPQERGPASATPFSVYYAPPPFTVREKRA